MNPYTNRIMIKDKRFFFGRNSEIKKIFSRIGGGRPQSVSVIGMRNIGKSSLLFHAYSREIAQKYIKNVDKYVFVFVDLQMKKSMDVKQFFQLLQREIRAQAPPELTDSIPEVENTYDGFAQIIQSFDSMKKKIVLFMDEFEVLVSNEKFEADFFAFLRSLANLFELAYVISSKRELFELCKTQEIKDSPFWNIFDTLWLGLFDRESSLDLIRTLSSEEGYPLEDYADFILKLAGAHPFYLQLACCIVFDFLVHHEGISEEDFKQMEEEFKEESRNYLTDLWRKLDGKEENGKEGGEKKVLRDLLAGKKIEKIGLLHNLEKKGVLENENGKYVFFSEVFSDFVKEEHLKSDDVGKAKPARTAPLHKYSLYKISQVLSSKTRYEILKYLAGKEAGASELEAIFKISKTAIKNNLKSLLKVELIEERVVLKPIIMKLYYISEKGREVLETFDEIKKGGDEEPFDHLVVEVGPALKKDEGKHIVRISTSAKEKLKIKSGNCVILESENGTPVQCEAKTLRGEKGNKVLIDGDSMLLLDVERGDSVILKKRRSDS